MTTEMANPPATVKRKRCIKPWFIVLLVLIAAALAALWYSGVIKPRPKIAIITGGKTPYWDLVILGANDASKQFKVRLTTFTPPSEEAAQTQAIRDLIGQGYDGVAISPLEPITQADALAELAAQAPLVTFDSDSAVARRLCFIGTNNYEAGRLAAQYIRSAIPDGGDVIITIGSLVKTNGQERRQGVIDELLDRSFAPARPMDVIDGPLKGGKYNILTTLVDGFDPQKATQLAADAIKKFPTVKCFAGLFAYNAPAVLKALEANQKLGQIQVVAFDTNEETLAGIEAGNVSATIMQDPYSMGYSSVRILGDVARGDSRAVPLFQVLTIGCHPVTKAHVAAVRQNPSLATTHPVD